MSPSRVLTAPPTKNKINKGGASLHLCMTPHGPDAATFEAATAPEAEAPARVGDNALAFMFETSLTPRVTPAALGATNIDWCVRESGEGGALALSTALLSAII
jgi:hypothetical protein